MRRFARSLTEVLVPPNSACLHLDSSLTLVQALLAPRSALSTAQSIAVSSLTQINLIFTFVVLPVLGWLCCYCSTSVLSLFFHVFHCRTISLASLAYTALSYYLSPLLPAEFLNSRVFCFLTEDFTASTRYFFFSLALFSCCVSLSLLWRSLSSLQHACTSTFSTRTLCC